MYSPFMRTGFATFVFVALVSLPALEVQAQPLSNYGVKAGLTSATVSTDMFADGIERREGFAAMAFAEWFETPYFSVLSELGYVQRGHSETVEVRNSEGVSLGTEEISTRFDYLTVAALAKLRYSEASLEPYVIAGPRGDVLIRRSQSNLLVEEYDVFALGGTVGAGVGVGKQILPVQLMLEVRYNADITDSLSCCPRQMRNQAFDILLGIGF